ncbi:MAG: UDP-N-acetylmuramate--L-alanine ligase [Candidatus Bipolaricaulota bacterium]|nr:UDP-N-acetylmuramate--L-alanine ligase [Candidatus Bipolaricaulota bacterium]
MIGDRKRYHFVGIGGAGMSGLAAVMLARGASISGSDLHENDETVRLRKAGAQIHVGHDPRLLEDEIDAVIVSSAIGDGNVEVRAAREREVPVVKRLHALASLLSGYKSVGIAGTHGKTTTTAMVANILVEAGMDPSYLVGAHCPGLGGNSHLGRGQFFVTEVDESDGLFLALEPSISVLTNVGRDHLNTYRTLSAIKRSFRQYVRQSGQVVLAIDDRHVGDLAEEVPNALTVGLAEGALLRATSVEHHRFHSRFELQYRGQRVAPVFLPAPGDHNVRNALCAIGAAHLAGLDLATAATCLSSFRLPERRFQLLEENGVTVVDDYAHLPEQIQANLKAIRDGWENRRIVAIFQPHRYTRTQAIGAEFGVAFQEADTVVVTSIYPACEQPIPGVSSQAIVEAIASCTDATLFSIERKEEVVSFLESYIEPGDFIISFGAGDIWTVTEELSCFLKQGRFCTV